VIGMRERAFACGGQLDICPNSDGGTTVQLLVPLNGARHK
jgi:signal transduction histidine kinase